ncbi:oleate hydratase [Acetobacter aceti]|nr:oleate hydratase [Acetobacter aceti]
MRKKFTSKIISGGLSTDFRKSNFCLFWRSMFTFEPSHSVIEMKRYLARFAHQILGQKDLHTLKFTKYNQQESLDKPWRHGLLIKVWCFTAAQVTNVAVDLPGRKKITTHVD